MLSHRYDIGDVHERIYDVMVEALANGAVVAMRGYFDLYFDGRPPRLDALDLRYRLPEGRDGDSGCQVTPIGAAFFEECNRRGAITCKDAAIYHAAWSQCYGDDAWVAIDRPNGIAHAVVVYPVGGYAFDPSQHLLTRSSQ